MCLFLKTPPPKKKKCQMASVLSQVTWCSNLSHHTLVEWVKKKSYPCLLLLQGCHKIKHFFDMAPFEHIMDLRKQVKADRWHLTAYRLLATGDLWKVKHDRLHVTSVRWKNRLIDRWHGCNNIELMLGLDYSWTLRNIQQNIWHMTIRPKHVLNMF